MIFAQRCLLMIILVYDNFYSTILLLINFDLTNHRYIYFSINKAIQTTIKSFNNSVLHLNICIHVKNLQHHSFMLNICVSHLHQNYIKGRIQIASYIKVVLFSFYLLSKLYGHMIMLIIQYFCYNKSI